MKALIKALDGPVLKNVPKPAVGSTDVLIKVLATAFCRTDYYVANNLLPARPGVILGHETTGIVEIGPKRLIGKRVFINPLIPCGHCNMCQSQKSHLCPRPSMLGWQRDGAFSEYLSIPKSQVWPSPDFLTDLECAYIEPIAASLSVIDSDAQGKILLFGDGRIAELTKRLFKIFGKTVDHSVICDSFTKENFEQYDTVIECSATTKSISLALDLLKPGGTLILKSRPYLHSSIDTYKVVQKQIKMIGKWYGDFKQAQWVLENHKEIIQDLIGSTYSFDNSIEMFSSNEEKKIFLVP